MMMLPSRTPLSHYHWKGINTAGKRCCGKMLASHESDIRHHLKNNSITLLSLKRRNSSLLSRWQHKARPQDITVMTRQLATMLASGVTLVHALKLISHNQRKAEMRLLITRMSAIVESGTPISQAMGQTSVLFDDFYRDLVKVGEQSGRLSDVIERLATYREKSQRLKAKLKTALIYPTLVLATAIIVSYLMLAFVVPQFEAMFAGLGAQLPWFTQQVLKVSRFIQNYTGYLLLSIGAVIWCCRKLVSVSPIMQLRLNSWVLKLPVVGSAIEKSALSKFCRSLSTSVSAGVAIHHGLASAIKTTPNLYYQKAIQHVFEQTLAGMPIYIALRERGAFPALMVQMIMVGEESGQLDDMLRKVADIYQLEIDNQIENLEKSLEPLMVLLLGTIVGSLVVALYLPIFNLMNVLG